MKRGLDWFTQTPCWHQIMSGENKDFIQVQDFENSKMLQDIISNLSRLVGKPTMWFPSRSDTNQPVQLQKQARSLKFWS